MGSPQEEKIHMLGIDMVPAQKTDVLPSFIF